MSKKGKSLVDSLVFHRAKDAVDRVTKAPNKEDNIKDQDHIRIVSISDKDRDSIIAESHQDNNKITEKSDKDQINIPFVSDKEHHKISSKDHSDINIPKDKKNITNGAVSVSLSKTQSDVYLWFSDRGLNGEFNKPEIQHSLSMPYITVRKAISKLEILGILELEYDKCLKTYDYSLNSKVNIKFSKKSRIISGSNQDQDNMGADSLISSSSLINKTTTKNEIEKILTENPELGYWRQKGLTKKQIEEWMKVAGCDLESIIKYLGYCRFEMVDLGVEESKPVNKVHDWFFRIIEKAGHYPKPKGYRSYEEKEIERRKNIFEEKQNHLSELQELREREMVIERDIQFEEMLQNPKSELHKRIFGMLNDYSRKLKPNTKGYIRSMRIAFDEYIDKKEQKKFEDSRSVVDAEKKAAVLQKI
jgi:hypothetical protein